MTTRPHQGRDQSRNHGHDLGPARQQGSGRDGQPTLRVNPIACDAHGLCAELLPELVALDPWGYPIIRPGPVPPGLLPLARRAVRACPTLALLLSRQ